MRWLLLLGLVPATLAGQSPEDIKAAVERGYKAKSCDLVTARAKPFGRQTGFNLTLSGPLNRIECAAAGAAKEYQVFTVDSVTEDMREVLIIINAYPLKPEYSSGNWSITPPATHLVLRIDAEEGGAIQPDTLEFFETSWSNMRGASIDGTGATAVFRGWQEPRQFVQVVVVTDEREYRTKISADALRKLR